MLRNSSHRFAVGEVLVFLNEVLSLNAQESCSCPASRTAASVLNEVLSLNAQEFVAQVFLLNDRLPQ